MGSSTFNPISTPSEAHPETMDFLSTTWCDFAVQALQPDLQDQSIALLDNPIKSNEAPFLKMEKNVKMDDAEFGSVPPLKSNDVKSWLWMQQAMHPELNYSGRKKWFPWKLLPFKTISIKKWWKEIKLQRKEERRLQNAQVHAAISVAGLAAALAAIAAENKDQSKTMTSARDAAVASAAALVAAQCAEFAKATGAKREQLRNVIGSAMSSTSASDILTLSAAAATSLRGAAALKARTGGCKNRVNGSAHVLPIEDNNDFELDFEKCKSILAKGAELGVETQDGNYIVTSVFITLNSEAKVTLKMKKLNMLKTKKQCVVVDMHAELYKDSEGGHDEESEATTCYLIVLSTNKGTIKLDMADDYHLYKTWTTTISHMLMLSTSFTNCDLQFYTKP
ncbi:hypothetical protein HS088_TW23G00636 [Tripterygium wilfordii]|uniref:VAN3-binding protein n=1 Tax=Tripterygium wilfordii TaxID=458696 RepID=A0A7J7BVM8_TRIWF|nr:VAN3-binding protein [Tripterygium wilfordii]KAF5725904.1 hypothetical protein HS088_TW23G00636 [Tripterygium wilfordii]